MADRAWLESSLRRSACLGRQVLDRASRRTVDWTSSPVSQTTGKFEENAGTSVKVLLGPYSLSLLSLRDVFVCLFLKSILLFKKNSLLFPSTENTHRAG